MQNFMTIDQVAKTLTVHKVTVNRLIKSGKLKAIKVNRAIRVAEDSLEEFIKDNALRKNVKQEETKQTESLQGIFKGGGPIPAELIDEVIAEWDKAE
jgi:excisionase family DNA binding protein